MHSNNNIDLEKIQFKNKNTSDPNFPEDYYPINASSLNQLQSNVDEYGQKIQDDLRLVEKSISNINGKILWTNPNPLNDFGNETINFNSSDFDVYEVFYYISTDNLQMLSCKSLKGHGSRLMIPSTNMEMRRMNVISDTSYSFETPSSPKFGVPIKIIGYKTGLFD